MSYHDEFQETTIRVATPSEKVFVSLRGEDWAEVRFAPGFYETATGREMADQLARALRLLHVERTRVLYEGLSRQVGDTIRPGTDTLHPRAAEYRRRLQEIVAEGSSPGGEVTVVGTGLTGFHVTVAPGVLGSTTEQGFADACTAAGLAFLAEHQQRVAELKFDVYIRPDLEAAGVGVGR